MSEPPLNHERVAELLRSLRQRTPREITVAVMGLGCCFTPEMWRALELLAAERSTGMNGPRKAVLHERVNKPLPLARMDRPLAEPVDR